MSPRPQIDHIRKPQLLAAAADVIAERGFAATRIADVAERAGTSPPAVQITVWLGNGASLVALEQATYRVRPDDRWKPGTPIKLGWHPEHCLVLR